MIFLLSWRRGVSGARLVLVGIGVNALLAAVISFLLVRFPIEQVSAAATWQAGTLAAASWSNAAMLSAGLVLLFPPAFVLTRRLRVLQLGDEVAGSLGLLPQSPRAMERAKARARRPRSRPWRSRLRLLSLTRHRPEVTRPRRGESLAQEVDDAIAAASVYPDAVEDPLRVIALYVRGTAAQLVLGESSNTRWLIEAAGGIDVSAPMGITDPVPISAEAILAAAPQVVLVPEAGLTSVNGIDGLLEIGGLGETPAGQDRRVLAYDDQLLLGNGPRTPELLARLRDDLGGFATDPEGGPDE